MTQEENALDVHIIQRVYLEKETLGSWYIEGILAAKTMELPLIIDPKTKLSTRNKSCILEGDYICIREAYTVKHPYPHFRIINVPGRNGILVHRVKFIRHLLGCIGIGSKFVDFDRDGIPDMDNSKEALQELYERCPDRFILRIMRKPNT